MSRIADALYILFKGTESFMAKTGKDGKEMKTTFVKETERYTHEDVPGVNHDDLDVESFRTVSFPTGYKLVVAKNKKTNKLDAVRFLVPTKKK